MDDAIEDDAASCLGDDDHIAIKRRAGTTHGFCVGGSGDGGKGGCPVAKYRRCNRICIAADLVFLGAESRDEQESVDTVATQPSKMG